VARYNDAGIENDCRPPARALDLAQQVNLILASRLKRSVQSAAILSPTPPVTDDLFREADIPTRLPLPSRLHLFPLVWIAVARVFWLLGWSGNSESYRSARKRAASACEHLGELASQHGVVMLVGHQAFNLLLARELRSRGWKGPVIPPLPHWSLAVYESHTADSAGAGELAHDDWDSDGHAAR
jgi:broad specificity phosphatase PhoE